MAETRFKEFSDLTTKNGEEGRWYYWEEVDSSYYYKFWVPKDVSFSPTDNPPASAERCSKSSCYLTTACVVAADLPDNCYELETLRSFRDGWLTSQPFGSQAIKEYYSFAPKVVEAIDKSADRACVYKNMFKDLVQKSIAKIEQKDYQGAYETYRDYALELKKKYL